MSKPEARPERVTQVLLRGVKHAAADHTLLSTDDHEIFFVAMEQPAPVASEIVLELVGGATRVARVTRILEIAPTQRLPHGPTKPGCYARWLA